MSVNRVEAARLGWALLLLAEPQRIVRVAAGRPPTPGELWIARLLGLRHAGQAAAARVLPPRWRRLLPLVDGLHAGSMVAVAVLDRSRTRVAGSSAAVAATWAALEWSAGRSA